MRAPLSNHFVNCPVGAPLADSLSVPTSKLTAGKAPNMHEKRCKGRPSEGQCQG